MTTPYEIVQAGEREFKEKANVFIRGCELEKIGDKEDWKAMKFAFDEIKSHHRTTLLAFIDGAIAEEEKKKLGGHRDEDKRIYAGGFDDAKSDSIAMWKELKDQITKNI